MSCGKENEIEKILSIARNKIAEDLKIIDKKAIYILLIVDYPMFELDEKAKK